MGLDKVYKVWDLKNYEHIYSIHDNNIYEIKISPVSLSCIPIFFLPLSVSVPFSLSRYLPDRILSHSLRLGSNSGHSLYPSFFIFPFLSPPKTAYKDGVVS